MSFSRLISRLKLPVLQAPMAGGVNNPTSVAAIANSGGVGSFGFAYTNVADIERLVLETRSITNGPINANFFVFPHTIAVGDDDMRNAITTLQNKAQMDIPSLIAPTAPYFLSLANSLKPIWQLRPDLLTFHFGIPAADIVSTAKENGIIVGMTATSPEEAIRVVSGGADFVIAQGIEAGGHRGFLYTTPDGVDKDVRQLAANDKQLGTLDLVVNIMRSGAVKVPVVAAGGIMCGADIREMIRAGAAAVQMGTAFLTCEETTASRAHKRFLTQETLRGTVYTTAFSGRPAQCIRNSFVSRMATDSASHSPNDAVTTILPFPVQNTLTGAMRRRATQLDDGEHQSLYAGAHYAQCRPLSTAQLMDTLKKEFDASA